MMAQTKSEMEEEEAEDLADKSKQIKRLRYIASLKRFTLNRTRVALASHKLAQAVRESGQAAMSQYLPYGGSYVNAMSNAGDMGMEGYHFLMSLFTPRKLNLSTASAVIGEDGKGQKELDLGGEDNPAEAIQKLIGGGKTPKSLVIQSRPITLIKNHSTRVALFTMAACAAEAKARKVMKEEESENEQVREYNALLHKNGIVADVEIAQLAEIMPKMLEEAARCGFVVKTKSGDYLMEEKLEATLHERRARRRHLCIENTRAAVFRLLMWYYTCFHAEGRRGYGAMPSVLAEPDEQQMHVFRELQPQEETIKHPDHIMALKFAMEKSAPPLPANVWGPAFVAIKAGKNASWAAALFAGEEKAIADAMPLVGSLAGQPLGRGSKFLDALKKKQ